MLVVLADDPLTLPVIVLVTTRFVKVPMLVIPTALVMPAGKEVPVRLPAFTLPADPVTLPAIGLVTVRLVNVPTLVKLDVSTFDAKVAPVSVPAAAAGNCDHAYALPVQFNHVLLNAGAVI